MASLSAQGGALLPCEDQDGFEGAEKVLEIDFVEKELQERGSAADVPAHDHRAKGSDAGMRAVSRLEWDSILDLAQCKILTHESNNFLDSYVLSESSLFVYSHKIVLKTCGTTTLLRCIPALLEAAAKAGLVVEWISFTRKDFLFPNRQAFPHTSFDEEVKYLLAHFPEGSAYVLGPITGEPSTVLEYVRVICDACFCILTRHCLRTRTIKQKGTTGTFSSRTTSSSITRLRTARWTS